MKTVAYSAAQWESINVWAREHRALIHCYGPGYASQIAKIPRCDFPDYLRDWGWSPCRFAAPTATQIVESLLMQNLWRRDRYDYAPRLQPKKRGQA